MSRPKSHQNVRYILLLTALQGMKRSQLNQQKTFHRAQHKRPKTNKTRVRYCPIADTTSRDVRESAPLTLYLPLSFQAKVHPFRPLDSAERVRQSKSQQA